MDNNPLTIDLAALQTKQLSFLTNFASRMALLQAMAERELAQQPFTAEQTNMVTDLIERYVDYNGVRLWSGWYPSIYYRNTFNGARDGSYSPPNFPMAAECDLRDLLVVDVHTDQPDPVAGDPGAVIHEGIGNINMMLIAVDNGPDRVVYAGPVLSHYEFETAAWQRLTTANGKACTSATTSLPHRPGRTHISCPGPSACRRVTEPKSAGKTCSSNCRVRGRHRKR